MNRSDGCDKFMSTEKYEENQIRDAIDSGLSQMHFKFDPDESTVKRRRISVKSRIILIISAAVIVVLSGFTLYAEVNDISFEYLFHRIFGTDSGENLDSISDRAKVTDIDDRYNYGEISVGKLACDNKRVYLVLNFERKDGLEFSENAEYNISCKIEPQLMTDKKYVCEWEISKGVVDEEDRKKIYFVIKGDFLIDNGRYDIAGEKLSITTGGITVAGKDGEFVTVKGNSNISVILPESSTIITKRFSASEKSSIFSIDGKETPLNITKMEISNLTVYMYSDYADCQYIKNMPITIVMKNGEETELSFDRSEIYDDSKSFIIAHFEQPIDVSEIDTVIFNGEKINLQ